jgi:hypothetical protein
MPIPLQHLRQALPGTACRVACGALLPPNTRHTPESCRDLLGVNELHAGLCRSLVQLASFGWSDAVGVGRQGCCTPLQYLKGLALEDSERAVRYR